MSQNKSPKKLRRYVRRRDALDAAMRFRVGEDGTRYVIRFTPEQRIQHWILLLSFTTLAITGLAQTFEHTSVGYIILLVLGGIESARQIHHVAAVIFGVEAIYHFAISIYEMFVYRRISRIWPDWSDFTTLIDMLKLNLGLSHAHPKFDRFNFEEKAEYWALIWGTIVMGATGLMQWFPLQVTSLLPGWMIPVANALHRWEAVLAVLAILTWHFYHTLIKTRNFSIFSGVMTEAQMKEEHPIELAYLEQAAMTLQTSNTWPALIEITVEEEVEQEKVTVSVPKATGKEIKEESVVVIDDASSKSVEQVTGSMDEQSSLTEALEPSIPVVEIADQSEGGESVPTIAHDAPLTESLSNGEA